MVCFVTKLKKNDAMTLISQIPVSNVFNLFSSPVVCLCHGFMSVVDRAPCSRWCLCRAKLPQDVDGLNLNLVHIFIII